MEINFDPEQMLGHAWLHMREKVYDNKIEQANGHWQNYLFVFRY